MHNLAVLYAEGIDGKPDYKVAAQWFRKAARFGVADSQYNLAILYARGIGVEANLAESYKWFALAAANGDGEAADASATRWRPARHQTLAAASSRSDLHADREPDEATSLRAPPGGWDRHSRPPRSSRAKRSPCVNDAVNKT